MRYGNGLTTETTPYRVEVYPLYNPPTLPTILEREKFVSFSDIQSASSITINASTSNAHVSLVV